MTVSEDLNFVEEGEEYVAAPTYPTAFGITFTPTVSGILLAAAGALGALFILLNLILPAWEVYQQQQEKRDGLQGEIQRKRASINQIGQVKQELAGVKQQQRQVLALFANEKTLDTLLLDLNREVRRSGTAATGVTPTITKFTPANQTAEVINDGSLGTEINGKLKSRIVNVEVEGSYAQTENILRRIELLQPLLIVKNYQSNVVPRELIQRGQGVAIPRGGPEKIKTSFQLQALIPANPNDAQAATAAPAATSVPPKKPVLQR